VEIVGLLRDGQFSKEVVNDVRISRIQRRVRNERARQNVSRSVAVARIKTSLELPSRLSVLRLKSLALRSVACEAPDPERQPAGSWQPITISSVGGWLDLRLPLSLCLSSLFAKRQSISAAPCTAIASWSGCGDKSLIMGVKAVLFPDPRCSAVPPQRQQRTDSLTSIHDLLSPSRPLRSGAAGSEAAPRAPSYANRGPDESLDSD